MAFLFNTSTCNSVTCALGRQGHQPPIKPPKPPRNQAQALSTIKAKHKRASSAELLRVLLNSSNSVTCALGRQGHQPPIKPPRNQAQALSTIKAISPQPPKLKPPKLPQKPPKSMNALASQIAFSAASVPAAPTIHPPPNRYQLLSGRELQIHGSQRGSFGNETQSKSSVIAHSAHVPSALVHIFPRDQEVTETPSNLSVSDLISRFPFLLDHHPQHMLCFARPACHLTLHEYICIHLVTKSRNRYPFSSWRAEPRNQQPLHTSLDCVLSAALIYSTTQAASMSAA